MNLRNPRSYAKAIVGAAVTGLTAMLPLVRDGVSLEDWIFTAIATLVAFSTVWATTNEE